MFSRQHYQVIAKVIKDTDMDPIDRSILIDKFCVEFAMDNNRFDRDKFVKAATRVEPLRVVEPEEGL